MKTLLVLTLVAAVYARPEPGFAYSVVDPGQGNAAVITSNVVAAQQPVVYAADPHAGHADHVDHSKHVVATPNVITYAQQPVVYTADPHAGHEQHAGHVAATPNVITTYAQQPVVYTTAVKADHADHVGHVAATPNVITTYAQQPVVYNAAAVPAATPNVITTYAQQPVVYTSSVPAATTNVVTTYAQQPIVYTAAAVPAATPNVITTYAQQPVVYATDAHVGHVAYFSGACHNNDGQVVPCAGEESLVAPQPVGGEEKLTTPVQSAPAAAAAPAAPSTSQPGVIDLKKREAEADPLYYYNTINPAAYAYAHQPIIYSQAPVVAAAPAPAVVYTAAHVGCMNNEGKHVACIGEPEPVESKAMPLSAMPEAMAPVEAKSSEPIQGEQTALEAAAAAAKDSGVVSVKKREAEADPLYYTSLPYTSPLAVTPNVYAQNPLMYRNPAMYQQMVYAQPAGSVYAQQPIIYQAAAGCRNNQGSLVPCAMGQNFIQALPLMASPAPVMSQMVQGVAPVEQQKSQEAVSAPASAGAVIELKKREADSASDAVSEPLYYGDTYKFPGYTYRAFGDHAIPVAAPQTYTVSAPIVTNVATAPVASTTYVAAPVAAAPVAATSYVASSPIIAAVQPGCRNEMGSVVPCA